MGFVTNLLTLPLAPVRATAALADQIRRQAEQEFYDPARIRHQLELIGNLRASGDLTEDEATAAEDVLIARLLDAEAQREGYVANDNYP
ncbi:gas vesicle protein GvpG [Kribbella amoyensis]|uniref:Gas vesicle protein GvpG n=1 Tax=Kribbella amoyensis TaxID=996641 RepID=A0A561BSA7_9ACTN|nr:gas vesicle protein GvpG [Kribbella amoyensis]TWD81699.1 gas vesicle protein GvpG [Kribbella amoyensis]